MFENLPTELTELILMQLSMRDAFRSSTVSKNWIHAWNTIPKLVLDDKNFTQADNKESMFVEFVDRVLSSRKGPIVQFHLSTSIKHKRKINRWLFLSSRDKIKELHLEVRRRGGKKYWVSSRLFSCHELVHLKLVNCKLTPHKTSKLDELALVDLPMITEINIRNTKVRQLNIVGDYDSFQLENQSIVSATLTNKKPSRRFRDVQDLHTIFFCKNLVHLEISGYENVVLPAVRDMKLETVKLNLATSLSGSITNLISQCPQLKNLDVTTDATDYQEIQVVSKSLQSLKIGRCYYKLQLACPQLINASIYIDTDLYYWDSVDHYSRSVKSFSYL
ncbi:hypothetical protein J5N97_003186 [Dioscorea zingiberensis]|uniref:F-box domain-containing protein n=1 Tax=Dioscorea zingiberensis TaxID=325984 RepID=A0A9D5D3M3_9LILI|nr:hypothetical protein J5N97_003186 [Dioscorea zingiberensis]